MAQVNVSVNGKAYTLACAEGDQDRPSKLAAYVDEKIGDLLEKEDLLRYVL